MNTRTEAARTQMVKQQVRAWDVLDPAVLDVLARVPREDFAPARYRSLAFADTFIPLPCGECMLSPQLEGRMLQALAVTPEDRVLEVGTGSGFTAACLARLGGQVESVELHPELAENARVRLQDQRAGNVAVVTADVFRFEPAHAFNVIAVTGSLPVDEPRFREWLAPGGRLFVVVGEAPLMEALLLTRTGDREWREERLFETSIPPLHNTPQPDRFVF